MTFVVRAHGLNCTAVAEGEPGGLGQGLFACAEAPALFLAWPSAGSHGQRAAASAAIRLQHSHNITRSVPPGFSHLRLPHPKEFNAAARNLQCIQLALFSIFCLSFIPCLQL